MKIKMRAYKPKAPKTIHRKNGEVVRSQGGGRIWSSSAERSVRKGRGRW